MRIVRCSLQPVLLIALIVGVFVGHSSFFFLKFSSIIDCYAFKVLTRYPYNLVTTPSMSLQTL